MPGLRTPAGVPAEASGVIKACHMVAVSCVKLSSRAPERLKSDAVNPVTGSSKAMRSATCPVASPLAVSLKAAVGALLSTRWRAPTAAARGFPSASVTEPALRVKDISPKKSACGVAVTSHCVLDLAVSLERLPPLKLKSSSVRPKTGSENVRLKTTGKPVAWGLPWLSAI